MSTSYPLYICCREFPGVPRGDYLLATGARCSPKPRRMTFAGECSPMLSRMELPGDYLRATGARCSPGITFAPQALGVPRGGGFSSKNAKQQGATFYGGGPGKTSSLVFTASCHKKDTDFVRVFAFLELAERGGFEPPEPIRVQRFSRPPRSTAPASLRSFRGQGLWFGSEAEICRQRQTRWYIPASLRGWQR